MNISSKLVRASLGAIVAMLVTMTWTGNNIAAEGKPEINWKAVNVEVTGENFCLDCALKNQVAVEAQCRASRHVNGLKVLTIICDGKRVPGWEGRTLNYLYSNRSRALKDGNAGKTLDVTGVLFPLNGLLQVNSFKLGEGC